MIKSVIRGFTKEALKVLNRLVMTTYRPLVISGPSGSGKSTLVKQLMKEYDGCFAFSVSHTTRKPRPGEVDGVDYHFVSKDEMLNAIQNKEFIEHAEFSGNLYGTSKKAVEDVASTGRICILDIDMQGVKNIKKTDINPRYIFIKAPSMDVLEQRLRDRKTETEDAIMKRLSSAKSEITFSEQPGAYDHLIVNDDKTKAYLELKDIVIEDVKMLIARSTSK